MSNDAGKLWEKTCEHLRKTLPKDVFYRWIDVIEAQEIRDDCLFLKVTNDFYQTWLEDNYLPIIQSIVSSFADKELKIQIIVDHSTPNFQAPVQKPLQQETKRSKTNQLFSQNTLNPKYTFDSFVVGSSNNFAHAATLAVAQSPAKAYNPLFIYGGVGLGKTHLMQAIGQYVMTNNHKKITYISSEAFVNEYIEALQHKELVQFRRKYRNCDLLLIDDIHFLSGKERMQEEFFHTFNTLYDNHKQIVLTSDRPASEITGLEQRLVSRFEWGLVTELEEPDIETRIAILRNKQAEMNISLHDEILHYIAERIRSNIRRLEGALIRVASYSSLTGRTLNKDFLEYLLRDVFDHEHHSTPSIESIQRMVADYFDLRLADMSSNRRPKSIAFPRQIAMYLSRTMTEQSLPMIGNAFARNHATVIYACRLVEEKLKKDSSLRQTVSILSQRIGKHRNQ